MGRLRAYVELSRGSNLPTCWSSVLTGAALGAAGGAIAWERTALAAAAVSAMYVAGMALNDAADAPIDARERPERPIPSGRLSRRAAAIYGAAGLAVGLALAGLLSARTLVLAAALAACIVAYDLLHRRFAGSVLLMGACRGLVYLLAAAAAGPPAEWRAALTLAGALTLYVVLLTVVARREAGGPAGARRWLAVALPLVVVAPAAAVQPESWLWSLLAGALLVAWLGRAARLSVAGRLKAAVGSWLAGICLIDAFYLSLLDRPLLALAALACFGATLAGHRRVAGT